MRLYIVTVLLIVGCYSCTTSRPMSGKDMKMPDSYRAADSPSSDSVLLPWSAFFKEPKLGALIDKALQKNSDIIVSLSGLQQLELTMKQARYSITPNLDLTSSVGRTWKHPDYADSYGSGVSLTWEVDIWGKSRLLKRDARAQFFAQSENLLALKTRIISQVAIAYITLVSLDEQLVIAKRNIELSDSTLTFLKLQYAAGQVTSLAVDQAEGQKKSAELLVPQIRQNISLQETSLSILCGSFPDSISRRASLEDISLEEKLSAGVPAMLLSRRPDVKAAELSIVSAAAKAGLAHIALYPSFSLSSQIGTNSAEFSKWFDLPGSVTKNLTLNLAAPLFQKRALNTAYRSALLEQAKVTEQFKKTVLTAVGEVTDALAKRESAEKRLVLALQKSHSMDMAAANALNLYRSGMATYLEVITANSSKLQNDLDLTAVRYDRLAAIVELYRALGGGTR